MNIVNKREEPLLSRTRLEGEVLFDKATPSTKEIKSNVAKSLGKDESLVDIEGIYNHYGQKKAKVVCYNYENEDIFNDHSRLACRCRDNRSTTRTRSGTTRRASA